MRLSPCLAADKLISQDKAIKKRRNQSRMRHSRRHACPQSRGSIFPQRSASLRAEIRHTKPICASAPARVGAHLRSLRHVIILIFEFAHIHRGEPSTRQQKRFGLGASQPTRLCVFWIRRCCRPTRATTTKVGGGEPRYCAVNRITAAALIVTHSVASAASVLFIGGVATLRPLRTPFALRS